MACSKYSLIGCEKTIYNDTMGVIYSPGFPNEHRSNVNCTYTIKRAGTDSITILFPVFDLKEDKRWYSCRHVDWIEVSKILFFKFVTAVK